MKRLIQILAVSVLGVLMMSCSEEFSNEQISSTSYELKLRGDIKASMPATRVDANGFVANDKVGVYVSNSTTLAQQNNMLDNEAFTYTEDGNLDAPEGKAVYWGSDNVRLSVWAYYPYSETVSDNSAYEFAVAADQSTAEKFYGSDFITASKSNLPPQEAPVTLEFDHRLSKIAITFVAGEDITADELSAAEKSLSIGGMVLDGTIDLATGNATIGQTSAEVTPYKVDGLNYAAIVYPHDGKLSLRLEMGENVYTYSTDFDYQAGYQYKYTLKVNVREPLELTLASATINPWQNEGEPTEGEMSDIITFSDPKFKVYLLENYDENNDGEISIAEAEEVRSINVSNLGVTSLAGIEYFVNLTYLDCYHNQLTALDVSNNTALTHLYCPSNKLSVLDLSNNTALEDLDCHNNQLTALDMSNNKALIKLRCNHNQLTALNVSNNTALTNLDCGNNQLTALNVSSNTALDILKCNSNQLTALDVSNNTALEQLGCGSNQLTAFDVSNNVALKELQCNNNQLTSLNLSSNTALVILICSYNKLSTLDVSNNMTLEYLRCNSNQLTALDVLSNTTLYYLFCEDNQLTALDVSNNKALEQLGCDSNQLTALDVSKNTVLTSLSCGINQLTTLDVSNNTALTSLTCERNQLTTLDVSSNTALIGLGCKDNKLTVLNLSNNTALKSLFCYNNQLTALDVSNNVVLEDLECYNNKLITLDVSNNKALTHLWCTPMNDGEGNNILTTLYLAEGQSIGDLQKPDGTTIEYK